MPTVMRDGPYRFYFHSHEPGEPPHIHVDRDACSAKYWLAPVALARNIGFGPVEVRKLQSIVLDRRQYLLERWHGYFGRSGG